MICAIADIVRITIITLLAIFLVFTWVYCRSGKRYISLWIPASISVGTALLAIWLVFRNCNLGSRDPISLAWDVGELLVSTTLIVAFYVGYRFTFSESRKWRSKGTQERVATASMTRGQKIPKRRKPGVFRRLFAVLVRILIVGGVLASCYFLYGIIAKYDGLVNVLVFVLFIGVSIALLRNHCQS